MEGTLVGIGVDIAMNDGECVVEHIIPGGPADRSNRVFDGDKIISIQQPDEEPFIVFGQRLRDVVKQLRGETGSLVTLEIKSAHSKSRRSVELTRQEIDMSTSRCRAYLYTLPGSEMSRRIAVILIPQFYGDELGEESEFRVTTDVKCLIEKLSELGMEALVLDVRGNPGGLMYEAVSLTGLFIKQGPVIIIENSSGETKVSNDPDETVVFRGPLALLISRKSASASEILAGSLAAYHRAIIVGDITTYGKGTMQNMHDFSEFRGSDFGHSTMGWGGLSSTTAMFFTAAGQSTQKQGVASDIVIQYAQNPDILYEADLPHALDWKRIESALPDGFEGSSMQEFSVLNEDVLQHLKDRSLERMSKTREFDWWHRLQGYRNEIHSKTEFSLNLDQRTEEYENSLEKRRLLHEEGLQLCKDLSFERETVLLNVEKDILDRRQEKWKQSTLPDGNYRANRFYKSTFYWQEIPDEEIVPIRVREIDYSKLVPDIAEIHSTIKPSGELLLTKAQLKTLLTTLEKEKEGDFDCRRILEEIVGDGVKETISNDFFSDFFHSIIVTHQEIGGSVTVLEVPLRECMRVLDDWLTMENGFTQLN